MTITIGALRFDHVDYDANGDVLYLIGCAQRIGEPQVPADSFGTPEGHNVRYDTGGSVIGVTLVNLKWLLERDGAIGITIASRVPADGVAEALAAPST